jgi:hypothetical protein
MELQPPNTITARFSECTVDCLEALFMPPSTTSKAKAQATINFEGNAAYVFGGTDKNHGTYTVAVDSGPAMTFNATTMNQVNFQVLLVCILFHSVATMTDSTIVLHWVAVFREAYHGPDKLAR